MRTIVWYMAALALAVGAVVLLAGCSTPRYDWGGLAKGVGRVQEGK